MGGILRNLRHLALVLVASVLLACGGDEMMTAPAMSPSPAPVMSSGPYDLLFTGAALAHARQLLFVAVIKVSDGSVTASDSGSIGPDGSFSFSWEGILEAGESYRLDFFADHNQNRMCDPPPTDHSWQASLGTVTGPVSHHFQHNADFYDVCASFS